MSCTEECEGRPAGRVEFAMITKDGDRIRVFRAPEKDRAMISGTIFMAPLTPADLRQLAMGLQDVAEYLEIAE